MTDPINLNKVRKARAHADAQTRAEENRVRFGRTKAQKALDAARQDKHERTLTAHKREPDT